MRQLPVLSLPLLIVSGCMVGPDYERPEVAMPLEYSTVEAELQLEGDGASIANLQWWALFDDPAMRELIELALQENRDLRVAIARVEEARARVGVARSDLFPGVNAGAGFNRGNTAELIFPGAGINETWQLQMATSYELDFWGKFRRATESARAELLSSIENQRTVLITLISDVASTYLLLRDLDARVQIAEDTVDARRKSTEIISARYDKGTVPLLDVNQAEIQEADAVAQLANLRRQTVETENQLSVLIGSNPTPIVRGYSISDQSFPPAVPAGLPSTLLERRPDIRSAEQTLAAQTARIGVAQAARFPSITLTGSWGVASQELSDLIESDSEVWLVGVDVLGPVFDGKKRRSQVEQEVARAEQALNDYEQTVLRAMQEVEDALAGIRYYREELQARDMQVKAAKSYKDLSWARYDGGVTDYLEVLDADRTLFSAQLRASEIRRLQLVSIVRLYRALGGGWIPPGQSTSQGTGQETAATN